MREPSVEHHDLREYGDLRLAIISDTHGDVDSNVLDVVAASDVVLHAGDIMGADVLERLSPRLGINITVRGNNDVSHTWRDGQEVLNQLSDVALIKCQGGDIAMEHGHLLHQIKTSHWPLGYRYPDARMVVYGHTHVQRLDQESTPWLVNPGAAGLTRNQGGASCYRLVVEGEDWSMERFKFPGLKRTG